MPRKLVRDVWTENNWDERKIRAAVLPVGVENDVVEEIMRIPISEANKDVAHWAPTPQGNFTSSSAWDLIRHQQESMEMGAVFNSSLVIDRIQNHLQLAILARKILVTQWKGLSSTTSFKFPRPRRSNASGTRVVRWQLPQHNWTKLNIAGAFLGTTSPAGGEGIIRDEHGNILRGFAEQFDARSGMEVVLKALIKGVDMAKSFGKNIWIETDSQEVVGMVGTRNQGAAEHRHTLTAIRNVLKGCQCKFSHIPKIGNRIANLLANRGGRKAHQNIFDQESAPPWIRALARMDQ
ncbi:hypothetical protein SASPL_143462 [Salvia splendens]|uniref:RNase H type-1 domain-containing protein n=1 Tax=Salvia splendens TaxID=180675 RepID=A0A8X8WM98_SALSN|nr:hypothetical protein SASPL_143462 [Salvia splendens]